MPLKGVSCPGSFYELSASWLSVDKSLSSIVSFSALVLPHQNSERRVSQPQAKVSKLGIQMCLAFCQSIVSGILSQQQRLTIMHLSYFKFCKVQDSRTGRIFPSRINMLSWNASNFTVLWTLCPDVNSISFYIFFFNCCHEIMYLKEKYK